jgi:hypothetical protein
MASPQALTTLIAAAQAVSGVSSSQDIEAHRGAAKLTLEVSAVTGTGPVLTVFVETSPSGAAWSAAGTFATVTEAGHQKLAVSSLERFVRFRWTIGGLIPSFDFTISGIAFQVYAQMPDVEAEGTPEDAVSGVSDQVKARVLMAATDKVLGYLTRGNADPGANWGDDIRRSTSIIAGYDLMSVARGFDPNEYDINFEKRFDAEIAWLTAIAKGELDPSDDDEDDDDDDTGVSGSGHARVSSLLRRGW